MACLLFINGVTNNGKNLRIDIGMVCYLTTLPSKLFPPKLEHGQIQALQQNLNSFTIRVFVLFFRRQHVEVNYFEEGILSFLENLCFSAIVIRCQVNDNKALKTKCQSKPIVELSKLVNTKCTKKKCDDEPKN